MTLSPGKLRGLQTTSNEKRVFTILALDHGATLAQTVNPQAPETVGYDEMVSLKATLLRHLASHASAVLLDPAYGLAPAVLGGALPGRVGLLLAVEDGDYANTQSPARMFDGWSVAKVKQTGAAAVKCFFYYHPDDIELARMQEAFVADLVRACREYDLPLFAEPLSYNISTADRRRVVVETAHRISRLGIDVLKIEFPVDVHHEPEETVWLAACRELSAACVTPWALLSAGVDFAMFAHQVRVACQAGASGYLAGRAIWKEAVQMENQAQVDFLQHTAARRLQTLTEIASEHGRSWTEFYSYQAAHASQGWYKNYAR